MCSYVIITARPVAVASSVGVCVCVCVCDCVQVSGGAVGEVRLCVFVGVLPSVPRASSPISSAAVPALAAAAAGPCTGVRSGNDIPMITELGQSVLCQPCIPPGSLNRVPVSAGVRAGMSPLPGGR